MAKRSCRRVARIVSRVANSTEGRPKLDKMICRTKFLAVFPGKDVSDPLWGFAERERERRVETADRSLQDCGVAGCQG